MPWGCRSKRRKGAPSSLAPAASTSTCNVNSAARAAGGNSALLALLACATRPSAAPS